RLYRSSADHAGAQKCLRRALTIHRAAAGPTSHEASQDLYHLAASLEESGELYSAVEEYEKMLALRDRQIGANREETAEAQARLAGLYVRARRIPAARELLTHALPILERTGADTYVQGLETLARAEEMAGRKEEACRWREKAARLVAH